MKIEAEFKGKKSPIQTKTLAKIARCFTTDDNKNTTKRGQCLPSSI